jgi:hypothetical protein
MVFGYNLEVSFRSSILDYTGDRSKDLSKEHTIPLEPAIDTLSTFTRQDMDSYNNQLTNEALIFSWEGPTTPYIYDLAMSPNTVNGIRQVYVSDYQTLSVFDWDVAQLSMVNRVPLASTFDVTDVATELLPTTGQLFVTVRRYEILLEILLQLCSRRDRVCYRVVIESPIEYRYQTCSNFDRLLHHYHKLLHNIYW